MKDEFEFYDLAWNPKNKRGDEIIEAMNKKRASDPKQTNGEWVDYCYNNIAKTFGEKLFVIFTVGTVQGFQHAVDISKQN